MNQNQVKLIRLIDKARRKQNYFERFCCVFPDSKETLSAFTNALKARSEMIDFIQKVAK